MSNAYAGIKGGGFDDTYASFNYLGYGVNVSLDRREVKIEKDGKVVSETSNVMMRRSATMEEAIRRAKEIVIEHFDSDRRDEMREWHDEVIRRVEVIDTERYAIESYMYKGHQIDIVPDDFPQDCPWDDWDQEPSAMSTTGRGFGGWSHAYGKNDIGSIPDYRIPADVDRSEFVMRYINIAYGGVSEEFSTRRGPYIAYFTGKEIREWFNGDREFAKYSLSNSILTFKDWAEYGPHAYKISRNDEEIDSMWGIYDWYSYAYAISEAMAVVDAEVAELEAMEEEASSEKETELGYI